MLKVVNLSCERGSYRLFSDLDFSVDNGELLYVRGANGSGKTSLLRILSGLLEPNEGQILWQDHNINDLREDYYKQLTYIGHLNSIKGELSSAENLSISCTLSSNYAAQSEIREALRKMGLGGREDLPTKMLSQGQKRRVSLARLVISQTKLWVLDEPFTALDKDAVKQLQGLICSHVNMGGLVILTTHQEVELDVKQSRNISLDS